jgi:hypothetical protein
MSAASIGVDRPVESVAAAGHVVEGRAGADLVEVDPHRLGGVEGPGDGAVADSGQSQIVLDSLFVPPHTNIRSHTNRTQSDESVETRAYKGFYGLAKRARTL